MNFNSMGLWGQQQQPMMSTPNMGNTSALSGVSPDLSSGIFSQQGMFGQGGWVSPMTQAVSAGAQLWQGMQQMDLMKEQLAFQKDVFAKNWSNQVQLTNTNLYDRYTARQAGYGNDVISKDAFLATEGVK